MTHRPDTPIDPVDVVCLFSGGLDSFAGAVDLLAAGNRVCLVAHYEGGQAPKLQLHLGRRLAATYGRDRYCSAACSSGRRAARTSRSGPSPAATPIQAARVRELLEREHEIARTLSRAESAVRMYSQQLERAIARRAELGQGLAVSEEQRDRAQEVLHELDRSLVRRLHRSEIGRARGDLNQVQGSINRSVAELADIDRDLPDVRASLAQARATVLGRPSLERERHGIRRELDRDRSAWVFYLADDPPRHVLDRLGPRPERGAASDIWDEAAARLDQHTVAFDTTGSYPHLGRPLSWEDTAIAGNGRAVAQACEALDRSLGRAPATEAPGLELGL